MALNLERLKQIDDDNNYTVSGYIRKIQNELSLLNVPTIIYYLCLSYYYFEEYFEKVTNGMDISSDKLTVTHNTEKYGVSWCKQWIDFHIEQIVKWEIKMEFIVQCFTSLQIQFTSDDTIVSYGFYPPSYGFYCDGNTITQDESCIRNLSGRVKFKTGDILTITLNTKEKTIGVIKNDEKIYIIWTKIRSDKSVRYKLRIKSSCTTNSVSIINYSSVLLS